MPISSDDASSLKESTVPGSALQVGQPFGQQLDLLETCVLLSFELLPDQETN